MLKYYGPKLVIILILSFLFMFSSSQLSPTLSLPDYLINPDTAQSDYLVGAFYNPIWKIGTFEKDWGDVDDFPKRKPLLGYYDEGNPEVMDWEIKWASEHGISFFVFKWYREQSNLGDVMTSKNDVYLNHALHDGFLGSQFQNDMKFAIMIMSDGNNFKIIDSSNPLDITNVMEYLVSNYFFRSNYLKIDNKPVLFYYSVDDIRNSLGLNQEELSGALELLRQDAIAEGLNGLIILGNDENRNPQADISGMSNVIDSGFDASFSHRIAMSSTPNSADDAVNIQKNALDTWKNYGTSFIPIVSMGYDDTPWVSSSSFTKWRLPPNKFKEVLTHAKSIADSLPQTELGNKMILLDSWNEFGEGRYIAPHAEYEFDYLIAVRNVFTNGGNLPDYKLPQDPDIQLGPYDFLYHNKF